jgi:prepilin-type N-terminal cleavage/methylation domain-containing protein
MRRRRPAAGFGLVEVMVAVLLLSVVALSLTSTLLHVQHMLGTSARWMQAVQLAAAGMEQLRAGHPLTAVDPATGFARSAQVTALGHAGLRRLEVTVSWTDRVRQTYALQTIARP